VSKGDLSALLEAGDVAAVRAFFTSKDEVARRPFAKEAQSALKRFAEGEYKETKPGTWQWLSPYTDAHREGARVAVLCTCTLAELKKYADKNNIDETTADLWRTLRPSWLAEAADAVLESNIFAWPLARRLVLEGLSTRPRSDNYVLGMYTPHFHSWHRAVDKGTKMSDRLLEDPALLDDDIWRIFEVEGGGEHSLAAWDKYTPRDTWSDALVTLSKSGHLSRARLLDASLAALERDFAAFRAGWFSRFHETLAPTPAERTERTAAYLRLLGSPIPPTASFALDAIVAIDAIAPLAAREALPYLSPLLAARQKGAALQVLKLVKKMAARETEARAAVANAIVEALAHEAPDVQKAALDLLESFAPTSDAALRTRVMEKAPLVAASLKKRLVAWGGAKEPPAKTTVVTQAASRTATPVSYLDPSRALVPIATLDELIDRFAHVLEEPGDPDEVDLVLDGVARLSAERPADFDLRTGPLKKRARSFKPQHVWEKPLAHQLAGVALAWLGEAQEPYDLPKGVCFLDVFAARAREVSLAAAARTPRALLSAPTHRGGWIAPRVLVERVRAWPSSEKIPTHDAVIALLRQAPEQRADARRALGKIKGELADALRYALGGDAPIGDTAAIWIAAARARDATADDAKVESAHPGLGPDAGTAARLSWAVRSRKYDKYTFHRVEIGATPKAPSVRSSELPTVLLHAAGAAGHHDETGVGWTVPLIRWAASVWPAGRESFFAAGIPRFSANLDFSNAEWSNAAFLEPLRDSFEALGEMATLLLALGLAARAPGEHGLAIDAAIAALDDGRLTGERLGTIMAALLPTGLVKAARWAKTLATVAGASPTHATHVAVAMQRGLRGDPKRGPRDEGTLVELLRELLSAADAKVSDVEAWAYLTASRHHAKVKTFAPVESPNAERGNQGPNSVRAKSRRR
jgi:hypothetical protein